MKQKFYIISDFREQFPSVNPSNLRYFNDHPTKKSVEEMCELINELGFECEIWGGVEKLIHAYDNNITMPKGIYINMSDGLTQEYNRVQVPVLCDLLNLKYTGCNPFLVALLCNKHFTKEFIKNIGYLVPNGILIDKNYKLKKEYLHDLKYPLIIKPNTDGSSLGLNNNSICKNYDELNKVYLSLKDKYNEILIEEFISGYELTNMYIGDHEHCILNGVIFSKKGDKVYFDNDIFTLQDKSMKKISDVFASDIVDEETIKMIKKETASIVKELHITDICRIDYRLTKENKLYLLEINSVPRLSTNTNTVLMAKINNMSFEELLKKYLQYLQEKFNHDL